MSMEVYAWLNANESQYSATFSSAGQNDIQVVLSKGNPKTASWSTEKAEVT